MTTLMGSNKRVGVEEVMAVPAVPYTRTWHPIDHKTFIEVMDDAIEHQGVGVKSTEYSLSQNGKEMFGVMNLDAGPDGKPWVIGMRNSMDKKFAVGVCAGNQVTVCDNLMFYGDIEFGRKHTSGLTREYLEQMCMRALAKTIEKMGGMDKWFDGLANYQLPEQFYRLMVYKAMDTGAISPSNFRAFQQAFKIEKKTNDSPGTLLDFHGASTRLMRDRTLFQVRDRSIATNKICKDYSLYVDKNPELSHLLIN